MVRCLDHALVAGVVPASRIRDVPDSTAAERCQSARRHPSIQIARLPGLYSAVIPMPVGLEVKIWAWAVSVMPALLLRLARRQGQEITLSSMRVQPGRPTATAGERHLTGHPQCFCIISDLQISTPFPPSHPLKDPLPIQPYKRRALSM